MSIYNIIYINLCRDRKQLKECYGKGSNLHTHHIIPRHMGGKDVEENFTYLTVREHVIAHFLLWKIHKCPNDLRAMYMLGGNLTIAQRRITGQFARDNNLGFHGATPAQRLEWSLKGLETQKLSGSKDTFYFWSTAEGRAKRASLGGKASIESGNNIKFAYWSSKEGQKQRASLGGKSHIGKVWINKDGCRTRVPKGELQKYIDVGWHKGSGPRS